MTGKVYTDADKMKAVDLIIRDLRWAANDSALPENWTLGALKALYADLHAATPTASNRVLDALDFQINSAMKSKARLGYIDAGHHQAVSECALAHWPAIRHALKSSEAVS